MLISLCAVAVAAPGSGSAAGLETPNIVLIVGDDIGYRDYGFMGSEWVRTPNLDGLAASGTVFDQGYSASSVDVPAVRALLTGLHPIQWRARVKTLRNQGVAREPLDVIQDFETLPGLLQKRGYRSFQAGRLYERDYRIAGFTHGLNRDGAGAAEGGAGAGIGRLVGLGPLDDFLDLQSGHPFFVWFAPKLPALPWDRSAERLDAYRRAHSGSDALSEDAVAYYASIERFDALVGDLLASLEARNLRERTLIVYLSDNGWDLGPKGKLARGGVDGPRGKGTLYELGFRTPIVFSAPGRIPVARQSASLVSAVDLFPTLIGYAGAESSKGPPGYDLRLHLEQGRRWPRKFVAGKVDFPRPNAFRPKTLPPPRNNFPEPAVFIREGRWRFISNVGWRTTELYDLENDPGETTNLARKNPPVSKRQKLNVRAWQTAVVAMVTRPIDPRGIAGGRGKPAQDEPIEVVSPEDIDYILGR